MSGWLGRGEGRKQEKVQVSASLKSSLKSSLKEFEIESAEFEIESASAKADLFYVGEQKWSVTDGIFGKRLAVVATAPEETLANSLASFRVGAGNNGG